MQIITKGKWRLHPFMEFYVIQKNSRGKNWIIVPLKDNVIESSVTTHTQSSQIVYLKEKNDQ